MIAVEVSKLVLIYLTKKVLLITQTLQVSVAGLYSLKYLFDGTSISNLNLSSSSMTTTVQVAAMSTDVAFSNWKMSLI